MINLDKWLLSNTGINLQNMGYERFSSLFKDFPGNLSFLLDPDPYRFCLDPDPYQSSPWIRIRNEFFHTLDPDPYQNDTDPPHWYKGQHPSAFSQPLLALSAVYHTPTTWLSHRAGGGRGWVGKCLEEAGGVLSFLSLIYNLWLVRDCLMTRKLRDTGPLKPQTKSVFKGRNPIRKNGPDPEHLLSVDRCCSNKEERWKQKARQRSSRLFGGQNLFNSLPRQLFCLGLFGRNGWIQPFLSIRHRHDDLCLAFCCHPSSMSSKV